MRKDCSLSKLNDEQQADLFDWLSSESLDSVQRRLAKSPPVGFGVKTHITTLSRFYKQRCDDLRQRDLADAIASAPSHQNGKAFIDSARHSHAHATFALANAPQSTASYRALSSALFQHDDLELRRGFLDVARQNVTLSKERLDLDRTQFEYNAARAALALHAELAAIHGLADIDDEEKIWRVRNRLFGPSASVAAGRLLGSNPSEPGDSATPNLGGAR